MITSEIFHSLFIFSLSSKKFDFPFVAKLHLDLNRAAANFTVLNELLLTASACIKTGAEFFAAIRTAEKIIVFNHGLPIDREIIFQKFAGPMRAGQNAVKKR